MLLRAGNQQKKMFCFLFNCIFGFDRTGDKQCVLPPSLCVHLGEGNDSEFVFLFKFICEIVRPSFCAHLSTPKISERDSPFLLFSFGMFCFVLSTLETRCASFATCAP